jgi:hypothetical protein
LTLTKDTRTYPIVMRHGGGIPRVRVFSAAYLIAIAAVASCYRTDPLFCRDDSDCVDSPGGPFCDVHGEYEASEHIARTCIPDPGSAGDAGLDAPGAPPDAPNGPHVVSVSPAPDADAVMLTAEIRATFSDAIDPTTVTRETFLVAAGGRRLPGAVSYDPTTRTATFRSEQPLPLAATTTASIATGVRTLEGVGVAPYEWTFLSRDGSWTRSLPIDGTASAGILSFDLGTSGDGIAVWQSGAVVAASRLTSTGWSTAQRLNVDATLFGSPSLAVSRSGLAVASWGEIPSGGSLRQVARTFAPASGWAPQQTVHSGVTGASVLAIDDLGRATIAYWTNTDNQATMRTNKLSSGQWGTPTSPLQGFSPVIDIDAEGTVVGTWMTRPTYSNVVGGTLPVNSAQWATVDIDRSLDFAGFPTLAANASGQAIAAWWQGNNVYDVWSALRGTDGTWAPPVRMEQNTNRNSEVVRVDINDSGAAVVAWHDNGTAEQATSTLWARRYTPAEGWDAEPHSFAIPNAQLIDVAIDTAGNVIVLSDSNGSLHASRFVASSGWAAPHLLGAISSQVDARVASSSSGEVVAVWSHSTGLSYARFQ